MAPSHRLAKATFVMGELCSLLDRCFGETKTFYNAKACSFLNLCLVAVHEANHYLDQDDK